MHISVHGIQSYRLVQCSYPCGKTRTTTCSAEQSRASPALAEIAEYEALADHSTLAPTSRPEEHGKSQNSEIIPFVLGTIYASIASLVRSMLPERLTCAGCADVRLSPHASQ